MTQPLRAPGLVRHSEVVPEWNEAAWSTAIEAAERVFGRSGVRDDTESGARWTSGDGRLQMETAYVPGGARLAVEQTWPSPRPWLLALSLLCLPTALAGAVLLTSREAPAASWAAVGSLVLVPVVAWVWRSAWQWLRVVRALGRIRRVLVLAERAARHQAVVWAEAEEWHPGADDEPDDLPLTSLLPTPRAAEWLADDELAGMIGARPACVTTADLRSARRIVERVTAERRPAAIRPAPVGPPLPAPTPRAVPALPEGFAEWRP